MLVGVPDERYTEIIEVVQMFNFKSKPGRQAVHIEEDPIHSAQLDTLQASSSPLLAAGPSLAATAVRVDIQLPL